MYHMSLPSNRVEFWMAMESERFLNPVLREMYRERDVIAEERRQTLEASPINRLIDEMKSAAFMAHPYGISIVGHMSDIYNYDRETAAAHFHKYYTPNNMVIAIVGDVETRNVIKLAEKYWGRLERGPDVDRVATVEPEQNAERRVKLYDPSQPLWVAGYHIPSRTHPDFVVLEALADYVGQGRTSILHRELVKEKKIAMEAGCWFGYPGTKYPSLGMVFAMPATGHTNEECEEVILAEIEKLKTELIPAEELENIKARAKASLIFGLRDNMGLAMQLAATETYMGNWRELLTALDKINAITAEDIQRVAKEYLKPENRTIATIETVES
jgi:predicted Zn-dependent peptidase